MPPSPLESAAVEPVAIFAYGTLRSDSGSTAPYTVSFNEGCVSVPGTLRGAQMYFDSYYPYVVLNGVDGGEEQGCVQGMLVFPTDLGKKVREADKIEQEGVLYKRTVVMVCAEGSDEAVPAYVYVRDRCGPVAIPVEGGDWVVADKVALAVASLQLDTASLDAETARRAVVKANGDLRLAKSFLKWGIA